MKSIFSIDGFTFKEAFLLFCLEKEIIESDLEYSIKENVHEGKEQWFIFWKKNINELLVQLVPTEKLSIEKLDKKILCSEIEEEIINLNTNWKYIVLQRCAEFMPYDWFCLNCIENKDAALFNKANPNLKLDQYSKDLTLNKIASFLNIEY